MDWKHYFQFKHLETVFLCCTISFCSGVIVGTWFRLPALLFSLILQEIIYIKVLKCNPWIRVLAGVYYIFGWIVGRALFEYSHSQNYRSVRPWQQTYNFERYLDNVCHSKKNATH